MSEEMTVPDTVTVRQLTLRLPVVASAFLMLPLQAAAPELIATLIHTMNTVQPNPALQMLIVVLGYADMQVPEEDGVFEQKMLISAINCYILQKQERVVAGSTTRSCFSLIITYLVTAFALPVPMYSRNHQVS